MIKKISPQELAMRIVREYLRVGPATDTRDLIIKSRRFAVYAIEDYKSRHRLSRARQGCRDYVTDEEVAALLCLLSATWLRGCSEDAYSEAGSVLVQAKLDNFLEKLSK